MLLRIGHIHVALTNLLALLTFVLRSIIILSRIKTNNGRAIGKKNIKIRSIIINKGGVMKAKPKPLGNRHAHWRSLIGALDKHPEIAKARGVYMILIEPIRLKKRVPGKGLKTYNYRALVHGKGSDRFGKYIHQTDCHWTPEP
jgi:hypothetical protein